MSNTPQAIFPPKWLTVIIRDDSPFVHMQEPPHKRSVQIELTYEQQRQLELRLTGQSAGKPEYEEIAECFFEKDPAAVSRPHTMSGDGLQAVGGGR